MYPFVYGFSIPFEPLKGNNPFPTTPISSATRLRDAIVKTLQLALPVIVLPITVTSVITWFAGGCFGLLVFAVLGSVAITSFAPEKNPTQDQGCVSSA